MKANEFISEQIFINSFFFKKSANLPFPNKPLQATAQSLPTENEQTGLRLRGTRYKWQPGS
jgi:hypothetical protein